LPHQLHTFHSQEFIYPIGYKVMRYYWSITDVNKRCPYICSIGEVNGKPEFRVSTKVMEKGEELEKNFVDSSAKAVWTHVLLLVEKLRKENKLVKVFPRHITGEDLFGLTEPNIIKVLESLPGIESLSDYNFKYGRNPLLELPLAVNPSGCARSEPQMRTRVKRVHNFQRTTGANPGSTTTTSTSTKNTLNRAAKDMVPTLIGLETTGPYSKNFVQSKSSQYRKMKQEWRQNVVLARSGIQGLGLYAARDIEKHQMIIEYIGEVIRSDLTDIREKRYEDQNRGIYMFRLDDERVLDATMCGGMARYINHSCAPNCVTETVDVDRDLHIIIFANRRISRGDELCYDYKFDFEDDNKIPCLCGAKTCIKWMN
jgi:histone-lysine N-methyltransferase MLL3